MKKCTLSFFNLLVLLFFAYSSTGQSLVKGKVVDSETKEPLIGTTVLVKGTTQGTVTDFDGNFSLEVQPGTINLSITYIGYVDLSQTIEVAENETKNLGAVELEASTVGLEEVYITTSFARDRQTPVAISTIQPEMIVEKLGTQEFPEILKSTPSVYATKQGGGWGDSRINLRGFNSENIGVLINGVPVNDMENGRLYWSNWSGLSDVTQAMQVQRGLGASKVALSSVGGTINILTRSTDAQKGGSVFAGVANDGYRKQAVNVSTGLLENGWAVTMLGSHTQGDGYIKSTDFDAWTYFLNVSKIINKKHRLSFTAFGAPQWHNQRRTPMLISYYREHPDGTKFNADYGYRHGEKYNTSYNRYHKPQLSLNHYWKINNTTLLSTAVYASISQGGGRSVDGAKDGWLEYDYNMGTIGNETRVTPEGFLDFDGVIADNAMAENGSDAIISMSTNAHDWYGLLSSLNKELGNITVTAGFDGRYYKGYHYKAIDDLLGGKYYLDDNDVNLAAGTPLYVGDKFSYYNLGEVTWAGLFLQGEYVTPEYSAFVSSSVSSKNYRRIDYFNYTPDEQTTDWVGFLPWSIKGGFNYNIDAKNNVFVNSGFFTRTPFFNNVFLNYTNQINEDALYEKVLTFEGGYGYTSSKLKANFTAYWTNWRDKGMTRSFTNDMTANIPGISARHTGVELEVLYRPRTDLTVRAMGSYGDWIWQDDVEFSMFDENQDLIGTYNAYIGGIHVGNSAQLTAALGVDYEVLENLKLGADFNYFGKNYADFNPTNRTKEPNEGESNPDAWRMPDFSLVDLNAKYDFEIGGLKSTIYLKVNNLLDTEYVADADDGTNHNMLTSPVYFGFGRTWSTGLKVRF